MFNIKRKSIQWGGRTLEIETGKVARQADGAVMVKYGNTIVLCTTVGAKKPKEDVDFFPLTCIYQEKTFAAGRIPGGYFKREGRPTEKETLVSRLIDRPIRPLFTEGFYNETQVIATVLQFDGENDPDITALIAASASLAISGLPFNGPIAAAKVGYINNQYVLNPTQQQLPESDLEIVVAATKSSVMMVESQAAELSEEVMLGSVKFAHDQMQPVIKLIEDFASEAGKPTWEFSAPDLKPLCEQIKKIVGSEIREAYGLKDKQARSNKLDELKNKAAEAILAANPEQNEKQIKTAFKKLEQDVVRGDIIATGKRIDGRKPDEIRQITVETGILPFTHGSALFTRGETQALAVITLGTGDDEQMIDGLEGMTKGTFMLHYNFPPYSVGEVGRMGGAGRREIGHGKLAWRAIHDLLPAYEQFPYTLRIVSEVTESNGSSSMATVCASSLALMDGGVPTKGQCSGIAMGLILEGDKYVVLSDIMGDEDHLGDMDFKVAGTENGITSLQMDIKVQGITAEIMEIALKQAHGGRAHILGIMNKELETARTEISVHAPKITTIMVPVDKIREVIGSGGSVIRDIVAKSGAKVDINDEGVCKVAAVNNNSAEIALGMIRDIIAVAEVGAIYRDCKVVKVVDFGAFVEFLGKNQGLVHVSEMADYRVENVDDVVREGDTVHVKCIGFEKNGKVRLSMKAVDQETGEANPDYAPKERAERPERDRDDRGDRGGGFRGNRGGGDRDRGDRPRGGGNRGGDRDRGDRGGERGSRRRESY
jgi:polyribonucleotide nucleotidyltransferase